MPVRPAHFKGDFWNTEAIDNDDGLKTKSIHPPSPVWFAHLSGLISIDVAPQSAVPTKPAICSKIKRDGHRASSNKPHGRADWAGTLETWEPGSGSGSGPLNRILHQVQVDQARRRRPSNLPNTWTARARGSHFHSHMHPTTSTRPRSHPVGLGDSLGGAAAEQSAAPGLMSKSKPAQARRMRYDTSSTTSTR